MADARTGRLRDDTDFRRFLAARLVSLTGTAVTFVAFPVVVYELSGSPLLTALVAAFEALPYLLFGLVAGALADRFDRKRVMVATDLTQAGVLATIPVAHWLGVLTVPHMLAAAFVVPALFVFFDAADFGAVPTLVGRPRIAEANSVIWSTGTLVETAVPMLAGTLLALVDGASLIAVDVLSYLASAVLIRAIVRPLSDPAREAAVRLSRHAVVDEIREGLRFLWGHLPVRSMTAVGALQAVAGGAFVGQLVPWADRELDIRQGDWQLGLVFASWGVGALVVSLALPRLLRRVPAARVTLWFLPVSAALNVATALAGGWLTATLLMVVWGAAYMGVVINSITYRQQVTPEPLMSRVNTTGRMLSFGLGWPVGSVLGGVVGEVGGPQAGSFPAPCSSASLWSWAGRRRCAASRPRVTIGS